MERNIVSRTCLRTIGMVTLCATLLLGCSTEMVHPSEPQITLPSVYRNAPSSADKDAFQQSEPPAAPVNEATASAPWWKALGSDELNALMDRALANNPDLRIFTMQLAQTKIRADQVKAGGKPTITAPLRTALQAPGGQVGSIPVGSATTDIQRSYQASVLGAWRPDIWGEQSALQESADLQIWRALYQRENVQRLVTAELVNNYINYASISDALRIAHVNIGLGKQILKAVENRLKLGEGTIAEVEIQRSALATLNSAIPTLEQQREDARNSIAFLVGTVPSKIELSNRGMEMIASPTWQGSLPSSILLQRPDIRMIEARMRSAQADIGVARARLLPPVDLAAQVGYSSLAMAQLFQPQTLFWNAIGTLTATIFDGGKRQSDKDYAQAYKQEMVETYARTVLQAIREVEGALINLRSSHQRLQSAGDIANAARNVMSAGEASFLAEDIEIQGLLEAHKSYQRSRDAEERLRADYLRAYANLFQTLGGKSSLNTDKPAMANGGKIIENRKESNTLKNQEFWQVELTGLYHQSVLGSVWRDMSRRFGPLLQGRDLNGKLEGTLQTGQEAPENWYQLSVQYFIQKEDAERFCAELRANQQQCNLVALKNEPQPRQKTDTHFPFESHHKSSVQIVLGN